MTQTDLIEKVETIKTVLDRSALYRQSLAPVFFTSGIMGISSAGLALVLKIEHATNIILFWMTVAVVTAALTIVVMIQQAKVSGESFWKGPVQRMAQAAIPPLLVGALGGVYGLVFFPEDTLVSGQIVIGWLALYGLTLNGVSIVLMNHVKYLGYSFIFCSVIAGFVFELELERPYLQHVTMGLGFGVLHLLQGLREWKRDV